MFPIFFSVSSKDISFAEDIWKKLPDDWVYVYSKTGEEGAHMWDEISRRELPQSKLFVVFWSKNYISAKGCVREIEQASDLAKRGLIRSIILRLDDFPITWSDGQEEDARPVFDALTTMLDYRTSSPSVGLQQALDLVQRLAEPILGSDHPQLQRHDLLETLRGVARSNRFTYFPAVWVSGFNGVGRQTLTGEFNRGFVPNGRGIVVEVDEASLPNQIRLRLESEAFGADSRRLRQLKAVPGADEAKAVADTIERVFSAGNYVIFRHSRIVEENVELPEWLDDVVNALSPATRPKLFIISQLPLLALRRNRCRESLVSQRITTIDDHRLTEFSYQLIGHFDKNPARWTDEEITKIVRGARGTIGFLVSLVRAAAGIEDFDQIDQLLASDSQSTATSITTYVRWAFSQLRDFEDEQRALLFLNDISPCDLADVERAVAPKRPILRVLGKLLELGLIERETENLYRLTPLLAHRLSRELIRPDLLAWLESALLSFLQTPINIEEDGHVYLRIESRIKASILAGTDNTPSNLVDFVSAAHWFQTGVRLYHSRRREPAYRILKKAYSKRTEFAAASRVELTRYFCLSATRNRRYKESEACIKSLDAVYETKGMAAFLRADIFEHQRSFVEAISEYKHSLELNKGKESRLERTYRPLVRCILFFSSSRLCSSGKVCAKLAELAKDCFQSNGPRTGILALEISRQRLRSRRSREYR